MLYVHKAIQFPTGRVEAIISTLQMNLLVPDMGVDHSPKVVVIGLLTSPGDLEGSLWGKRADNHIPDSWNRTIPSRDLSSSRTISVPSNTDLVESREGP